MKKLLHCLIVLALFTANAEKERVPSRFSGTLLSEQPFGILIAGNISLSVSGGRVSFQSTQFQTDFTATAFEPVLMVQNKVIPFDLGPGMAGSFSMGEFMGPFPGVTAICGGVPDIIDPGFGMPVYWDGTRFQGSFSTFPGLENLLSAKGGTVLLKVHGMASGLRDPVFKVQLLPVAPPTTNLFASSLNGANEVPPNASGFHATMTFALNGSCLHYNLAVDAGLAWTSTGIYGPASPHRNSTNLVAALGTLFGVISTSQPAQTFYSGAVSLDDEAITHLKHGRLFVRFSTAAYPNGEIRGQILPVDGKQPGRGGSIQ